MNRRRVYFDHVSATPLLPEVLEAMLPFFRERFGNPGSLHRDGLQARDALELAREQAAALINAPSPEDILFTSGGTEAANLAVKGVARANRRRGRHIVTTTIEHPAVSESIASLEEEGFTCTRVGVDAEGRLEPAAVAEAIRQDTILVAVHLANHDLGTIQPAAAVARIAAERGIACYVDANIAGGWHPIDVQALGASLLSLAPHRFHGPKGVGVLYRSRRARLVPLLHGGAQENGRRAGTENVPAIVGAGKAAELAAQELEGRIAHTRRLQTRLWTELQARVPCIRLNGPEPGPERLPTNLNFSVEFIEGESALLLCDLQGIAVASGSSCVTKAGRLSPVFRAIGLPPALAQGNLLISLGRDNTDQDVDLFLELFPERVVGRLRSLSPTWAEYRQGRRPSLIAGGHPESSTTG